MMKEQYDVEFNSSVGATLDPTLLSFLTSVNIPAAGDRTRDLIATVLDYETVIGAQILYPDLQGADHSSMRKSVNRGIIGNAITQQVTTIGALVLEEDQVLSHIFPQGALFGDSGAYIDSAELLLDAVFAAEEMMIDRDILHPEREGLIPVYGLSNSALDHACRHIARPFTAVAFPDRAYSSSGLLVPLGKPGARIADIDEIVNRSLSMVLEGSVAAIDGSTVFLTAEVLHFSSDALNSSEAINRVYEGLTQAGITIASMEAE
jgi:UPF0271 protein